MLRKIIGITLLVVGGFFIIVLLTYGGPVWPHIMGPITLAVIGTIILILKGKAK